MKPGKKYELKGFIGFLFLILSLNMNALSQNMHASIGTDIPYQFYIGIAHDINDFELSYRSGILVSPYSDAILSITESLGAAPIYSDLLRSTYQFGWMNALNVSYKLGENKSWYVGSDFRYDKLTASKTSAEFIEMFSGDMFIYRTPRLIDANFDLGVNLIAIGIRFGKLFWLGEENKNYFRIELSAAKYIASQAKVNFNNSYSETLSNIFDDLLWEEVFKSYGYVGGIGISYNRKLEFYQTK